MKTFLALAALGIAAVALHTPSEPVVKSKAGTRPGNITAGAQTPLAPKPGDRLASFSAGCFWGIEEWYRKIPGVVSTAVGYTGGHTKNPTYEEVCTHTTGHAETVLVEYDPKKVSYGRLLEVFWSIHDPAQADGQGPNLGDNYRSAVWTYGDDEQKAAAASLAAQERKEKIKFVTTVKPAETFWLAEGYHQQYAEKTGRDECPAPRFPANLPKG